MSNQAVDDVILAHAAPDQPGATFRALDKALAAQPGHILFTILVHHPELRQNERAYTNMPDAYPVGGRKPVTDSPWMRQVLLRGEPFIGRIGDDIRAVFPDHELIRSLGCDSVLNMPVHWRGETLGTVNLLHRAGHYGEADVPPIRWFAHLCLPALLLIARQI
jgi:hypothetical protein